MIKSNKIRCKHCNDIIESKHRHDFVSCSCGAVAVDGGTTYLRRCFPDFPTEDHFEELSEEILIEEPAACNIAASFDKRKEVK